MTDSFLCCLSFNTGVNIIGFLQLKSTILYLILLAVHYKDTYAFYIPPAACHGFAFLCALACWISKGRESEYACRRVYYYTFAITCAFGLQSYWLVIVRQYPRFGE